MSPRHDIVLVYPRCGKYDLFIMDMPLGLLYLARNLEHAGYRVHIVDQRTEHDPIGTLAALLQRRPLWVGFSIMTGEPIRHALELAHRLRPLTDAPFVWGGIHPTILPEQTLAHPYVDYVIRGKGERAARSLSSHLRGDLEISRVEGLTYLDGDEIRHNPEDCEPDPEDLPLVNYQLVESGRYGRVGFSSQIASIMTSRNCPHRCEFCYNSSLRTPKPWMPDPLPYVYRHLEWILENQRPDYISFIDDDFFIDLDRARAIIKHLHEQAPDVEIGFRGARVSDLLRLDEDFLDLLVRANVRHINIGVESGSDRILRLLKKGMKVEMAIRLNRVLARYPTLTPLYNFFSGIPQETEEDIRLTTRLILQLVEDNPHCQISGYHQYTPYPGNKLFEAAVAAGYRAPQSLEDWGAQRYEDNARHCPWITPRRRRLLNTMYCAVYFVDHKYEAYIAKKNAGLRALTPAVTVYRHVARARMRHHLTALPLEVLAKDGLYRLLGNT